MRSKKKNLTKKSGIVSDYKGNQQEINSRRPSFSPKDTCLFSGNTYPDYRESFPGIEARTIS